MRSSRTCACFEESLEDVGQQGVDGSLGFSIPRQGIAVTIAREEAVIGRARVLDYQPGRVGVAYQVFQIDLARMEQFMDERKDKQAIGAGAETDPFIGDGGITAADRVD